MGSSSLRPTPTTSSSQTPQSMSSTQQPFSSWDLAPHMSTFPLSSTQCAAVTGAAPPSGYFGMAPLPVLSPSASHEMQMQAQRMFAPELGMHASHTMAQQAAAPQIEHQPQQRQQQQQRQPLSPPPVTIFPPSIKAEPQPKAAGRKLAAATGKGRAGAAAQASPADSKPSRKSGSGTGVEPPANADGKRLRGGDINKDKVLELEALLQQKTNELAQLAVENRSLKVKFKVLDRMVNMQGENLNSLKATEGPRLRLDTSRSDSAPEALPVLTLLQLESGPSRPLGSSCSIADEASSGGSSSKCESLQSAPSTSTGNAGEATAEAPVSFDLTFAVSPSMLLNTDPNQPGMHSELLSLWKYHYGGRAVTVAERRQFEAIGPVQLTENWKTYLSEVSVHLLAVETDSADSEAAHAMISLALKSVYMFKNTAVFNVDTLNSMLTKELETGELGEPEPEHWGRVVDILRFSAAQRQEICAIYKIYSRVMVRVLQERQAVNTLMSQALVPESVPSTFGQAQRQVGVDCEVMTKLKKSLAREIVAWRLLCGCFYGSILTTLQYVKLGVHSWPWFPSPVAICERVAIQEGVLELTSVAPKPLNK
ncbi:MAG: hypothetical protein WDW36_001183 [Sanguina aurantia]